jgi:hypothetical protein
VNRELLLVIGAAVYLLTLWGLLVAGYSVMSSAVEKDQEVPSIGEEGSLGVISGRERLWYVKVASPLIRFVRRTSGL